MSAPLKTTDQLPVMEAFYTIQGEGAHSGKAAYFIRLAGCDVGCVWCDVKESWEILPGQLKHIDSLVELVCDQPSDLVVITGGEPCMYDLTGLTSKLRLLGYQTNLETSGAYEIKGEFDWICVSPKKFKAPLQSELKLADELKVIIFHPSDLEWAEQNAQLTSVKCRLFLQPEYEKMEKIMPLIVDYVKANPKWNLSLQTHKFIGIP